MQDSHSNAFVVDTIPVMSLVEVEAYQYVNTSWMTALVRPIIVYCSQDPYQMRQERSGCITVEVFNTRSNNVF